AAGGECKNALPAVDNGFTAATPETNPALDAAFKPRQFNMCHRRAGDLRGVCTRLDDHELLAFFTVGELGSEHRAHVGELKLTVSGLRVDGVSAAWIARTLKLGLCVPACGQYRYFAWVRRRCLGA